MNLQQAQVILEQHPGVAHTGNPEEDRLLADVAGRGNVDVVRFLIDAESNLKAALSSFTAEPSAAPKQVTSLATSRVRATSVGSLMVTVEVAKQPLASVAETV